MGVSRLTKITMLVPRSELDSALKELANFEWFHPSQPKTNAPDPTIDALNSKVLRILLELDELVAELKIRLQPGLIETIIKGYKAVDKKKYTVADWADFTAQIEAEAVPLAKELKNLLDNLSLLRKNLIEYRILQAGLLMLSKFSLDLKDLSRLKRFYIVFTVSSTKNLKEIRQSLPNEIVIDEPVAKSENALLVAGSRSEYDRIEKVLRSYELKPFAIPEKLPQNPVEAYREVGKNIEELELREAEGNKELERYSEENKQILLTLREAAYTAYTVLNQMRKSGDLKRFAIIKGYVPSERMQEFSTMQSNRLSFIEEIGYGGETPTLFKNRGPTEAFQNITLTQGPPRYGEFDPTPIVALIFPIFYGMMFADFGQGIVLLILGLVLRIRGDPSMKDWGTIFSSAGIAATFFGLLVGEAFGVNLGGVPLIGGIFQQLRIIDVSELNQNTVLRILIVGFLIGVVHITIGLVLDVYKGFKERDHFELFTVKIPALVMYIFGVFFVIAFIDSGFRFGDLLTSSKLTSLIAIPISFVAKVTLPVILAAVSILVFGKAIVGLLGKRKGEGPAMSIILGLVEFILKLVEFLANTISYGRLGILLLVHASLMVLAKIALEGGLIGIPVAIGWNIAVMLIEGLIVYIQALRLHIYEWFTKFYEGTGILFQKILPETKHMEISWAEKNPSPLRSTST